MNLISFFCIGASYLIGAIPFGLVLTRSTDIDIRQSGSCNIGATNVTRLLGKKMGALTLLLDICKGFLPMYIAGHIFADSPGGHVLIALCGAATVIGHMYPVYLGFKGGKGVATGLGVFLYISPLTVLYSLGVFVLSVGLSGYVSLGSLLASAAIPLWLYLMSEPTWKILLAAGIGCMIWLKHLPNIQRLLSGAEKSWKKGRES